MPQPADQGVIATVEGKRVTQLAVTLRRAAFLVTEDAGTHEFTRVYVFSGGQCRAGDRLDAKLGPAVIKEVQFDRQAGLLILTSRGSIWAPAAECYANWQPA